MTRISLLDTAHAIVGQHLHVGDVAVDATMGNGHDTVFLARLVGNEGRVYGFDIQTQALASTFQRLLEQNLNTRVCLSLASHALMSRYIPPECHGLVCAIMFNLGYLPGADKSVITLIDSTLAALQASCRLLAVGGVVTVLAYPGHQGGDAEAEQIQAWIEGLPQNCLSFEVILSCYDKPTAPRLFVIRKHADLL